MATKTHPIDVPTEPGFYEAAAFPLGDPSGFVPIQITEKGDAYETDLNDIHFSIDAHYTEGIEGYARVNGPFRRLDSYPEVAA